MYDILEKDKIKIENLIYEINGIQIMVDFDLAKLYKVETKRINEAVKNNPKKFPKRFSWKLTEEQSKAFLVENFDQKKIETRGGRYKNPRVFTEYGIVMLSTILKSDVAIEISIRIIDAFVNMRHFLLKNNDVYKSLNNINTRLIDQENRINENADKINYLFSKFDKKEELFLKGDVYDAYSSFVSIFKQANNELIIVDSYADNTLLDIIRKLKCKVILITKNSDRLSEKEIQ